MGRQKGPLTNNKPGGWAVEPIARAGGRQVGGTSGSGRGRVSRCRRGPASWAKRGEWEQQRRRSVPAAAMPGIDKLPIEETLEDSPQVS